MLAPDADLEALTTTTLAAIQGGLLLATTSRDSAQLRGALDGAIAQLSAHSVPDKRRRATPRAVVGLAGARLLTACVEALSSSCRPLGFP